MPHLIAVLLAAFVAVALGGARDPAVIVRVNDGVQAYVVEEGVVYWVSGNVLRAQTVGGSEPRDLAVLEASRGVTTLVVDGTDVLVGAIGGTERSLHRVPRAGGEPLLVSDKGGPDVVRHGDQVRWLEVLGKTTSGIAGLSGSGTRVAAGPEIPGVARTLAFDADATYLAVHETAGGPGALVRRLADGAQRSLYTSDATLVVSASDDARVYLVERRAGLGRVVAVDKQGGTAITLFQAHYPGEFVIGPRVAVGSGYAYVAELDTRGDSDSGTLWRIPVEGGPAVPWLHTKDVVGQPFIDGDHLYFVEVQKRAGTSSILRVRL